MTKSCKGLTQSFNTLVQLQLGITSKVSNSLTLIKSGHNVWPDLGPNCLKGLSADDNVMLRFKAKVKYIGSTSTCYNLQGVKIRSRQNVRPDLGQNCLKCLSADDNVM